MASTIDQPSAGLAPGSFLTAAQQSALEKALTEKALENAQKAREHLKAKAVGERKSRAKTGVGAPKKAGGGGRFTWGSLLTDGSQSEGVMDKNDPNFDSDEERSTLLSNHHAQLRAEVQAYKQQVSSLVEEYYSSGDIADLADSLEDLGVPGFMHCFVKRLITAALDRNNRERELASVALSSLYANVIPPDQVQKGFANLVEGIDDLSLDVPDAPELLALFITRAVVDDVLPPAAAHKLPEAPAPHSPLGRLHTKVQAVLGARHGAEKVLRCWGSGVGVSYQDTKDSISRLLQEFASSRDEAEAARCLHNLNVPFFHHEVVKQAVHQAMEAQPSNPGLAQAFVALLTRLAQTGELSLVQLAKGLGRVSDTLADLCLDTPGAKEQHAAVIKLAKEAGLLDLDESGGLALQGGRPAQDSQASHTTVPSRGVAAFKAAASITIQEYFDSSDAHEVARRLQELGEPGLLPLFVKAAVVAALDRKARERELVSLLLRELYPEVLGADQMGSGFTRLLAATDDLVLDCPDAVRLLAMFLGRAIVDEVLPPAFLTQVLSGLRSESLGVSVVKSAGSMLSARHGAERLVNAWQGGALTLDQVESQITALLEEYLAGARDAGEACRCLTELRVPDHHHALVKMALEHVFMQPKSEDDVLALLASLAASGVISQTQMTKGFDLVQSNLAEEALDYGPAATALYATIADKATRAGWLVPS